MTKTQLPLLLLVVSALISGCSSAGHILRYNVPNITDTRIFPTDKIHKPAEQFSFFNAVEQPLPSVAFWANGKRVPSDMTPEEFLEDNATTAFLVIRNDTILYEEYFDGYSREKQSQVFSITKSVTSMLVGIAIEEGYIKGIDQPVCDFLPYCSNDGREKLTLNHLLQMTSGMPSDYKSLGKLINLYYTSDQEEFIKNFKQKGEAGMKFAYSSASTQMLGMCLEKATGKRFAEYLEEKLWKPLGMEYDAQVALDREEGDAKMFGGLTASAVDLAKLVRLYLHNGNWNGKQLVPESWVLASRQADTSGGCSSRYTKCWWLDTYPRKVGYYDNDFFAGGFRGQIVYGNPNDNTIIVRLGKRERGVFWPHAVSKLSLIQECEKGGCNMIDPLALEGEYKSKNGKFFNLKKLDDVLVLEDLETTDNSKIELLRDSNISFSNKDKDLKIIVDYRNHAVKGFFLEGPRGSQFFAKI